MRWSLLAVALYARGAFAIPPEHGQDDEQVKVEAELQKACNSKTKISMDWASFDDASMTQTFGPHLNCLQFAKAIAEICKNPTTKYGNANNDLIDDVPLRDLTEIRCLLDRKHEDAVAAWAKAAGKKVKRGDLPPAEAKLFADLPSPHNVKAPSAVPTAAIAFTGDKVTIAFTRESAPTFAAETMQVAAYKEGQLRAGKPGWDAHRKAVLDAAAKTATAALRSVEPGEAREGDERIKAKLIEANEKCGTKVTAAIDWAGLKVPDDDRSTASYAEKFTGMCWAAVEGFGYSCDDDGVKGRVAKAVKAISCRFDPKAYQPKKGSNNILKLESGTLTIWSDWESGNQGIDIQAFLQKKL